MGRALVPRWGYLFSILPIVFSIVITGYVIAPVRKMECRKDTQNKWRKRVGVEPTGDGVTRRPPVLKITWWVPTGYENSLLYLILQPLTSIEF